MGLSIEQKTQHPKSMTVILSGQINNETSTMLGQKLRGVLQQDVSNLVLDMAQVNFVSSAGISAILSTRKLLIERAGDLALVNLQPQVEKAFEVMSLLPTLSVFRNTQELDEYLARIQDRITEEGSFADD